jgi:hypothetical protein
LVIIGFIFWVSINLSESFYHQLFLFVEWLGTDPESGESLIIYNLDYKREGDWFIRNPGPFNEGGVFAVYLILALIINTIYTSRLWEVKNVLFILSILTTNSTAGYVALFLLIIAYYFSTNKYSPRIIILPVVILVGLFFFDSMPFLKEKITKQWDYQMSTEIDGKERQGRFLSARIDLKTIKENPLFGKGLYQKDRYITKEEEEYNVVTSQNGITAFAARHGLLAFIIYSLLFYRFLRHYCLIHKFRLAYVNYALIPIIAVESAQSNLFNPVFICLTYLGFYYYQFSKRKIINKHSLQTNDNFNNNTQL